ncbi:hypothetical protein Acr_15g0010200 [Actinidia rufa]|uniref:Uncharacterized protein n=1 Tax=Actinidia rufa TaxID=165716 RepID=A0A7J0FUN0_9ERIC|nr:hypothetical protein Acr_15g0010200 [Actinidia rufa]
MSWVNTCRGDVNWTCSYFEPGACLRAQFSTGVEVSHLPLDLESVLERENASTLSVAAVQLSIPPPFQLSVIVLHPSRQPNPLWLTFFEFFGLHQFSSNRACGGYFDAPNEAPLQCRGLTTCLIPWCGRRRSRSHPSSMVITIYASGLGNPRQPQTRFQRLFMNQSEECKAAIRAVNNRQALRMVTDLLAYEPIYQHMIPPQVDKLGRISLPTLCIEGWAPQSGDFGLKGFGADEEEEGEEIVNQLVLNRRNWVIPAAEPKLVCEVVVAHSFREGNELDTSSGSANMASRFKTLGQKKSTPTANPPVVAAPPISQMPLPDPTPVLSLTALPSSSNW